jgi:hypothetical protein
MNGSWLWMAKKEQVPVPSGNCATPMATVVRVTIELELSRLVTLWIAPKHSIVGSPFVLRLVGCRPIGRRLGCPSVSMRGTY